MPRGGSLHHPFELKHQGFRTLRIGINHRLRIPKGWVGETHPWLKSSGKSIECLALVGAAGGLVLIPVDRAKAYRRIVEDVDQAQSEAEPVNTESLRSARYASTSWRFPIGFDSGHFSFTLPEEARHLGLVPSAGEYAAVFLFEDRLEVWRADKWTAFVQSVARDVGTEETYE